MTDDLKNQILNLHARGFGVNEIAKKLSTPQKRVWPYSVRWILKHGKHLDKEYERRKAKGAQDYRCGKCRLPGHNARTCGIERDDNADK